jgi:hypothetical protein
MSADGKIVSGLSLTFDRFRQDQALQLINRDNAAAQVTGISINDVPNFQLTSLDDGKRFGEESRKLPRAEQDAYWKKLAEGGRVSENRIWLGNTADKSSTLQLMSRCWMSRAKSANRLRLLRKTEAGRACRPAHMPVKMAGSKNGSRWGS